MWRTEQKSAAVQHDKTVGKLRDFSHVIFRVNNYILYKY